jgi:hypothetical protein
MSSTESVSSGTVVAFNSVTTSPTVGSYNSSTYTYTVGRTGVYQVTVNLIGSVSAAMNIDLLNGSTVIAGAAGSSNGAYSPPARANLTAVVSLTSGATLTVKSTVVSGSQTLESPSFWSISLL